LRHQARVSERSFANLQFQKIVLYRQQCNICNTWFLSKKTRTDEILRVFREQCSIMVTSREVHHRITIPRIRILNYSNPKCQFESDKRIRLVLLTRDEKRISTCVGSVRIIVLVTSVASKTWRERATAKRKTQQTSRNAALCSLPLLILRHYRSHRTL